MTTHDFSHLPAFGTDPDLFADWQVVSFIDPAGTGSDLAFTQGLSAFDRPELLVWARPTEGLDPGADRLLTHRERCRLLNQWALELIDNRLGPGMEREERFDGGHSVARFRFGPPNLASPLQHPYLPPLTRVIGTTWSLLRRAIPPPAPLTAAGARRMERWIAASEAVALGWQLRPDVLDRPLALDRLDLSEPPGAGDRAVGFDRRGGGSWPGAVDLAGPGSWSERLSRLSLAPPGPDRFGPMTRWVDARVAQVLAADADIIATFLDRLHLAGCARCEECLLDELTRLATLARRNSACREASRVAQELGLAVAGPPGRPTDRWVRAVTLTSTAERGPAVDAILRTTLSDGLEILLVSAALADVAMPATTAGADGPWEWAASERRLPGRLWLARPAFRRAARELLAPVTPAQLEEAVTHAWTSAELPEFRAVSRFVTGLQTTAAASAQPGVLLRRDQSRGLPRPVTRAADLLAAQLLTAMALPHRFPEAGWELLRQSLGPLVPAFPAGLRVELP